MHQKSVTVRQIQRLDQVAIEQYGVPSLALMENAGACVARETIKRLKNKKTPQVCVFCGLGNNAGDGFVIARHLINAGIKVKIFLVGKGRDLKHDAAVNYRILKKSKYPIDEAGARRDVPLRDISRADIVIDAIFGVGLNRAVGEPFFSIIEAINERARRIIAVDIPSGLDGTTGQIYGTCIRADVTVTFSFTKKGFGRRSGPSHVGRVIVADIGIPSSLTKKLNG